MASPASPAAISETPALEYKHVHASVCWYNVHQTLPWAALKHLLAPPFATCVCLDATESRFMPTPPAQMTQPLYFVLVTTTVNAANRILVCWTRNSASHSLIKDIDSLPEWSDILTINPCLLRWALLSLLYVVKYTVLTEPFWGLDFVLTNKAACIYPVNSWGPVHEGNTTELVNTQNKPLIYTVDYSVVQPSQTGLILVFPFFI